MKLPEKGVPQNRALIDLQDISPEKLGNLFEQTMQTKRAEQIYDKLQLINSMKQVTSPIKEVLADDFVLASFDEKQKEFIIEMLKDAMFARLVLLRYKDTNLYRWNSKMHDWERNPDGSLKKCPLSTDDKFIIEQRANELFKTYMVEPLTLAVLNRNKSSNFILRLLVTGTEDKPDQQETAVQAKSIAEKVLDRIKGTKEVQTND